MNYFNNFIQYFYGICSVLFTQLTQIEILPGLHLITLIFIEILIGILVFIMSLGRF